MLSDEVSWGVSRVESRMEGEKSSRGSNQVIRTVDQVKHAEDVNVGSVVAKGSRSQRPG